MKKEKETSPADKYAPFEIVKDGKQVKAFKGWDEMYTWCKANREDLVGLAMSGPVVLFFMQTPMRWDDNRHALQLLTTKLVWRDYAILTKKKIEKEDKQS